MEIVDMQRRLDTLVNLYTETSDQDEQERLREQMNHYRSEILKARLAALEFELRYETDPVEKDHIANDRDAVKEQLDAIKHDHTCKGMIEPPLDEDGLIDGRESRGLVCPECGHIGCDCG